MSLTGVHDAQEARGELQVGRDQQKVVDVSQQKLQCRTVSQRVGGIARDKGTDRFFSLRKGKVRLLHVAVKQAAQQA